MSESNITIDQLADIVGRNYRELMSKVKRVEGFQDSLYSDMVSLNSNMNLLINTINQLRARIEVLEEKLKEDEEPSSEPDE